MEAAAGVSRAVGGDQQVAAVKIRRTHRYELQLHRPVLQTARLRGRVLSGGLLRKRPYLRPGAAAGQPVRRTCARLFCRLHAPDRLLRQPFELRFFDSLLVICRRFALDKADRIHWTDRQTVAKPVAVIVPDQLCFSVYDGDRALVARLRTQAAARAGRLVDFDDRPFHACPSCCFWASNLARRSASAFS